MSAGPAGDGSWTIRLADLAATEALGARLARFLEPGECLALSGPIGAGKTALARAVIRTLLDDPDAEAPSPTFALVQEYAGPGFPVIHADLYRLSAPEEAEQVGLEDLSAGAILLLEWPERLEGTAPADRLSLTLAPDPQDPGARFATLEGHGRLAERFRRFMTIGAFLAAAGWLDVERRLIQSDASGRVYERLERGGRSVILMIAPPRAHGRPLKRGRSYLQLARLSETVHAFVAITRALRARGFRAPAILAEDLANHLVLVEDLGSDGIARDGAAIEERYLATAETLAEMHALDWPDEAPIDQDRVHRLPPYDLEAYLIEVEQLLEWYVPPHRRGRISGAARARFAAAWTEALQPVIAAPQTWTLRDLHSPNVLWQADAPGRERVGLIDVQDALIGHPAYDLVSLGQDARVDVPPALELKIIAAYLRSRGLDADEAGRTAFLAAYAVLGAQRAAKILGIFSRLHERDGKPQYLAHQPRVAAALRRNLRHPALQGVRGWFAEHLPALIEED
jgi:hypothetical protein